MTRRWRELTAAIDRIAHQVDQLDRRTEKMEVILMVREPASGAAAEAYEGLRKQVVTAVTERLAHLSQLVQLDAALCAGSSTESVARLVRGWLEQASLAQVSDPDRSQTMAGSTLPASLMPCRTSTVRRIRPPSTKNTSRARMAGR